MQSTNRHTEPAAGPEAVDSLIRMVEAEVNGAPYGLFLYGSSAVDIGCGRDIDVVAVTSGDLEHRRLVSIPCVPSGRMANIYFVPQSDFVCDSCSGSFGGYYCEKFSLNFLRISGHGLCIDPATFYWGNAIRALKLQSNTSSAHLVREVHRSIVKCKPLFAAPLTKFLKSPNRVSMLVKFIDDHRAELFLATVPRPVPWKDINEKYWREYSSYKDAPGDRERQRTRKKIDALETEIDNDLITRYLDVEAFPQ